ncbi:MAG: hypothetical protein PWR00_1222 [Thermovirga sp.]|jgi:nucleoside-diphosphate-sugar epimerase|nr:hypothetical protein [Thermovirga sp.]
MKILILGANGFIGSHLCEHLLAYTPWHVTAFDKSDFNLIKCLDHDRFTFHRGDFFADDLWIEEQIIESDVVLPLVGIAKPAYYVSNPVFTFKLDFEANLKVIRMCVRHQKRVIFPSTSEVYGMSPDKELLEDQSPLVLGPVSKTRWIYSCSKQMMDRVIAAYGQEEGLRYTLFRPFNWIGPRLDTFEDAKLRKARSITQMIYDILHERPISLVGGGHQRRCFTWIGDGIKALEAIIRNENCVADGEIFNIGNPENDASIKELALLVIHALKDEPRYKALAEKATFKEVDPKEYYGNGYEDIVRRVPSIAKARHLLRWKPETSLEEAVRLTVRHVLEEIERGSAEEK